MYADPVAVAGDRNNPFKVSVTREKVAEPPHLPGQPAPTQCQDTGDCPPNFPGCKKPGGKPEEPTGKDGGEGKGTREQHQAQSYADGEPLFSNPTAGCFPWP